MEVDVWSLKVCLRLTVHHLHLLEVAYGNVVIMCGMADLDLRHKVLEILVEALTSEGKPRNQTGFVFSFFGVCFKCRARSVACRIDLTQG